MEEELQALIDAIPVVSDKRKYWFVRTNSGLYYEDFKSRNYVGIGYNEISLTKIKDAHEREGMPTKKSAVNPFKEHIVSVYPDETRPMYIGRQLIDFIYNIKKHDIVIIPSESSEELLIGEVEETPAYVEEGGTELAACLFQRRKKIKWIKEFSRIEMDSNLLKIIYVHRTVTALDEDLGSFVERSINKFYVKGGVAHLTLNVERPDSISALSFYKGWGDLLDLTDQLERELGIEPDVDKIQTKVNVNSPGPVELISLSITGILLLTIVLGYVIGVDLETYRLIKVKIKTDGLIKRIQDFKNDKQRRKLIESANHKLLNDLNVNEDQLVDIIKTLSSNTNGDKKENTSN